MIELPDIRDIELKICWVIALAPEANPIIDLFDLRLFSNELDFPVYVNQENGHALVISGIGKTKAAAATTYLKTLLNVKKYVGWINLGIAGFHLEPVGRLFQVIQVHDTGSKRSYFPGVRLSKIVQHKTLYTVSQPETAYLDSVLKIVSDTPESPIGSISKKTITQLIHQNIEKLQKIIHNIEKLVSDEKKRLKIPEEVFQYFDKYHFTKSNRNKFIQTYKKWKSAFPNRKLENTLATGNSASKLISSLESELVSAIKEWKL